MRSRKTKAEKKEEKKAENASPLEEMDADTAKEYGGMIAGLFAKQLKNPQVKIDADVDKSVGLVNLNTREGIIAIPVKNFKEDRENKSVESDTGMGICYLFMSQTYNPLVDGKPIDAKKLRTVKFTDADGNERAAICLLCSVKHVEGDDWQLYLLWGRQAAGRQVPVRRSQRCAQGRPGPRHPGSNQRPGAARLQPLWQILGRHSGQHQAQREVIGPVNR